MIKINRLVFYLFLFAFAISLSFLFWLSSSKSKLSNNLFVLKNELSESKNELDVYNKLYESLASSYLNVFEINKNYFTSYLDDVLDISYELDKNLLIFVNSEADCSLCIDNEMFFLESLVQEFDGEIVVFRNFLNPKDLKFFKSNFPAVQNIISIDNDAYASFFLGEKPFPFYVLFKSSQKHPLFFSPNTHFPDITKRFLAIKFNEN
ncbi:hypothetical protein [Mongoliitalea daihaiensis]|uniref:hypothetical protein n=1 Tax=Mongoliitalea daihaiensis TaxID=2782006 RepID=UPI001F1C1372|nr:hypothetical protein [Mongoliitalea daihaiensis]UJP66642.1 hypothetical protein IPZ59_08670 [Mongoliitalea daihaiensis]